MGKRTISKDVPLSEITLRRYEKPYDMPKRELLRKLCLSIGLLQVGDSRDVVVDILHVLHDRKGSKKLMSSDEVREEVIRLRKKNNLPVKGIAPSNIRRQLKRLRDLFLVEKISNDYRITEYEDLDVIFNEKIEKYYLQNVIARVRDYFKAVK